jgi:hypothetical protein
MSTVVVAVGTTDEQRAAITAYAQDPKAWLWVIFVEDIATARWVVEKGDAECVVETLSAGFLLSPK